MPYAKICQYCQEAAHVYFCLQDPRYLADPEGFVQSVEAQTPKSTLEDEGCEEGCDD